MELSYGRSIEIDYFWCFCDLNYCLLRAGAGVCIISNRPKAGQCKKQNHSTICEMESISTDTVGSGGVGHWERMPQPHCGSNILSNWISQCSQFLGPNHPPIEWWNPEFASLTPKGWESVWCTGPCVAKPGVVPQEKHGIAVSDGGFLKSAFIFCIEFSRFLRLPLIQQIAQVWGILESQPLPCSRRQSCYSTVPY